MEERKDVPGRGRQAMTNQPNIVKPRQIVSLVFYTVITLIGIALFTKGEVAWGLGAFVAGYSVLILSQRRL